MDFSRISRTPACDGRFGFSLRLFEPEFPRKSTAVPRTLKPNPPKAIARSTQTSRCCPYPGLQRRWTCPIRAVIAGRAQTVHFAQCGRAEGVRPPNGVDRDPFATFAACGGGRHGCTRYHLAGDAFCPGAAAAT